MPNYPEPAGRFSYNPPFSGGGGLCMENFLFAVSIIGGFAGLIWSADKLVLAASSTAKKLGVSLFLIGLTLVSFGTSLPEIFTSAVAALQGTPQLAIGNALGSNIANIGLVLGLTALLWPVRIPRSLLNKELPVLLAVTLLCLVLFADLRLAQIDGLILLAAFTFLASKVLSGKAALPDSHLNEMEELSDYIRDIPVPKALGLFLFSLALMLLSANILVFGAANLARAIGVSELIIGLSIVAIGTSLPELATTVSSALKGHHELAIGNIVGSNIMNLLLVLPVPALLAPSQLDSSFLWRDYGSMFAFTLLLAGLVFMKGSRENLGRLAGGVLLLLYLAYTASLFLMS